MRTEAPFEEVPEPVIPPEPTSSAPLTAYLWADGVVRLLTGSTETSPYGHPRNPLYCWDIDPDRGFAASNRRIVFDSKEAGLPIRDECGHVVDMAKLLPHRGGHTQFLLHRVRGGCTDNRARRSTVINQEEKDVCGIYYAEVHYTEAFPGVWQFE